MMWKEAGVVDQVMWKDVGVDKMMWKEIAVVEMTQKDEFREVGKKELQELDKAEKHYFGVIVSICKLVMSCILNWNFCD